MQNHSNAKFFISYLINFFQSFIPHPFSSNQILQPGALTVTHRHRIVGAICHLHGREEDKVIPKLEKVSPVHPTPSGQF